MPQIAVSLGQKLAALVRPPIAVLLGAGASIGVAPSTHELTEHLRKWKRFREPGRGSTPAFGSLIETGPGDARRPLFEAIRDALASKRAHPEAIHFEELVHTAELLGSALPIPAKRADRFRSYLEPFTDVNSAYAHWNIESGYSTAASEACYEILDVVQSACSAVDPAKNASLALASLAQRWRLRVTSLNYDDLALRSGVDFYTGFEPDRGTGGRYLPQHPWPRRRHTLAQVHGSVLFGLDAELRRFSSASSAANARTSRSSGPRHQDGTTGSAAPMITGLRKADKVLEPPFADYYHVLRRDFFESRRWLIVGYGFGDEHVNAVLRQAYGYLTRNGGKEPRVVLVDHYGFPEGSPDSAWLGTPIGSKLISGPAQVFKPAGDYVLSRGSPQLGRGLQRLAPTLAIHLGGALTALGTDLVEIEGFLGS